MLGRFFPLLCPLLLALFPSSAQSHPNPFARFFGEWTLKDNTFEQVWDTKTLQTITIPNHHTLCREINTRKSVLCVVKAGELNGHILWTYNDETQQMHHLSHFGDARNGVGTGTLDGNGNVTSKLTFQGEPSDTYRIYTYKWLSDDAYEMISRQYSRDGRLTGNWYGGTFVRVPVKGPSTSKSE